MNIDYNSIEIKYEENNKNENLLLPLNMLCFI